MLHQVESRILSALAGRMSAQELSRAAGVPLDSVFSFAQSLKEKGYVTLAQEETQALSLTEDGMRCVASGFPEERVLEAAKSSLSISSLTQEERSVGVPWATKNGWVKIESGTLKATGTAPVSGDYALKKSLSAIADGIPTDEQLVAVLLKRKLAQQKISKMLYLEPTAMAPEAETSSGAIAAETNILTREMLLSGNWETAHFRKYDVSAPVEIPAIAKRHMISRLRKKISTIFTDMGFEEMRGPEMQSSFWNFDALFQPQDHPARDLADTFYLKGKGALPKDDALLSRIKKIHEK
ncbi:MAG: hypothetical protein NTV88_01875, partial [Candidatus Micrarchaeota archaeon]|nr:hypothetical protein [Candidatus Micrarchaeota archaeon]